MSLESSSAQPRPAGQRRRLLEDPLVIRALAHPVRLELMSIISRAAEINTADAARELNISHGLASHHLRQLAKYGFVEQVDGKDNRERPWRATHTSHNWATAEATPETAAAAKVLEEVFAERGLSRFLDWQERRAQWPAEWREHTGIGQSTVYLTLAELAELETTIDAAISHYVEQRPIDDIASRPAGSVPIDFTYFVVPLSKTPEGS